MNQPYINDVAQAEDFLTIKELKSKNDYFINQSKQNKKIY